MIGFRWAPWAVVLLAGVVMPAAADEAWRALTAGGHVAWMRHALAPGTGDPASFTLGDCATQRNLSAQGREQARRIGDRFRAAGIDRARVYSSEWCRCLETARLLGLGPVSPLPALNSFYQRPAEREGRLAALRAFLDEVDTSSPVVLVTHQVTMTAVTGDYPRSGEIFVTTVGDAANAGAPLPVAASVMVEP